MTTFGHAQHAGLTIVVIGRTCTEYEWLVQEVN